MCYSVPKALIQLKTASLLFLPCCRTLGGAALGMLEGGRPHKQEDDSAVGLAWRPRDKNRFRRGVHWHFMRLSMTEPVSSVTAQNCFATLNIRKPIVQTSQALGRLQNKRSQGSPRNTDAWVDKRPCIDIGQANERGGLCPCVS